MKTMKRNVEMLLKGPSKSAITHPEARRKFMEINLFMSNAVEENRRRQTIDFSHFVCGGRGCVENSSEE